MDFSGIYEDQQFWRGKEVSRVEARDIPGTNCYCDEDAMNAIRSRIAPYSSGGIHFIDSGNYHYMTRIWLEKISEPFSLLVFDNHTDMQPPAFGGLLSCGGWIYDSVMELPLLKRVILIGPDEEAFSRVEPEIQEKVEFLSREKLLEMEEDAGVFGVECFGHVVSYRIRNTSSGEYSAGRGTQNVQGRKSR